MIYPEFLQKNSTIGVTAGSDGKASELDAKRLNHAQELFQTSGYEVMETASVRKSERGRSADAVTRATEFQSLLRKEQVKAVLMVCGGDFLMEMLSELDYELIRKHHKWIQGYSDPTGLLYTVTVNCDIATVYASNYGDFGMETWHSSLADNIAILEGKSIIQQSFSMYMDGFQEKITGYEGYVMEKEVRWRNAYQEPEVVIEGRLLGGCLDVLLNLVGTRFDKTKEFIEKYKEDGIVWYLESFDLTSEQLATGLWNLKEAGWFEHAKGFVFGRPCFYRSGYEFSYEQAVESILNSLQIPIIYDADFGHKPPRFTIINGAIGKVISKNGKGTLSMQLRS